MVYAGAFPLVLGVLPYALAQVKFGFFTLPIWVRRLHYAGVATLTAGSLFTGALEIYGTSSALGTVYWIAGAALLAGAVCIAAAGLRRARAL